MDVFRLMSGKSEYESVMMINVRNVPFVEHIKNRGLDKKARVESVPFAGHINT